MIQCDDPQTADDLALSIGGDNGSPILDMGTLREMSWITSVRICDTLLLGSMLASRRATNSTIKTQNGKATIQFLSNHVLLHHKPHKLNQPLNSPKFIHVLHSYH